MIWLSMLILSQWNMNIVHAKSLRKKNLSKLSSIGGAVVATQLSQLSWGEMSTLWNDMEHRISQVELDLNEIEPLLDEVATIQLGVWPS